MRIHERTIHLVWLNEQTRWTTSRCKEWVTCGGVAPDGALRVLSQG